MLTTRYNVAFDDGKSPTLNPVPVAEYVGPAEAVSSRREKENSYCSENGGYFIYSGGSKVDALWEHMNSNGTPSGATIYVWTEVDTLD